MTAVSGQVLITGATGFIGGYLVKHLSLDPALSVIAATRDGQGASRRLELRDPYCLTQECSRAAARLPH